MDQQTHRHTSVSQEKKEPLLRGKPPVIQIAKTTRSLTEDKVGDNLPIIGIRAHLRRESVYLLRTIKKSDGMDVVFLMVFPSPVWPLYFLYSGKIKRWIKSVKIDNHPMKDIEEIRKKAISDYLWIKKIVESAETPDHIKCCRKLVDNWVNSTTSRIRDYRCPFYKTSEVKKTIETYRRSRKELIQQIADKSVSLIHPLEII